MCDVTAPIYFVTITYNVCQVCGETYKTFLLIPKVGPLKELDGHRGTYYIEIQDLSMIDDWEIELSLSKQEVSPVDLGKYEDFVPWELSLCASTEIEFGILSEEQFDRILAVIEEQNGQLPDEPVPAKPEEVKETAKKSSEANSKWEKM